MEEKRFQIRTQATIGEYTVKRVNMSDFEVIHNGSIVFEGEDYEVADFLKEKL